MLRYNESNVTEQQAPALRHGRSAPSDDERRSLERQLEMETLSSRSYVNWHDLSLRLRSS